MDLGAPSTRSAWIHYIYCKPTIEMKTISHRVRCFLVLIGIGLFLPGMRGQEAYPKYNFVNITEGISRVGIYSIVQDNYGFIWLGTNGSGLYRYDGVDFKSYKHILNDSTSLNSSLVFRTYFDRENRLWAGTEQGLNLYDRANDRFKRIPLEDDSIERNPISISAIQEDNLGKLYIGGFEKGLYRLDPVDFKVEKIKVDEPGSLPPLIIETIQKDSYGKIYVGTDRGLFEIDAQTGLLKRSYFRGRDTMEAVRVPIKSLLIDQGDNLWIGTFSDGLIKLGRTDIIGEDYYAVDEFLFSQTTFFSLIVLPDGTLMCATENNGLFHITPKGKVLNHYFASKNDETGMQSNSIWSLYLDDGQRIWLGYYNKGLALYDRLYDKFNDIASYHNNPNSLQISSVTSIVQQSDGKFLIGLDGGGIDIVDLKKNDFTHINLGSKGEYTGLGSDYILNIFIDDRENIWAGSWDKGIYFLKKGSRHFVNYHIGNTDGGLLSNTVVSIDQDSEGILWFGTYHRGIHSFDPRTQKFEHHDSPAFRESGLWESDTWKVMVDHQDQIWVGTTRGLFRLEKKKGGEIEVVPMSDKMSREFGGSSAANHILSLYEGEDRSIWIGTKGAGLCRYEPDSQTFTWYNKLNGLMEENVCAIIESAQGTIWVSGNSGITELNPITEEFTNYTTSDGLLSNDFNMNSTFIDAGGNLYFGGYQGVNYFNPTEIPINTSETSLYLSDLKLFNEIVLPTQEKSPLDKVISEMDSIVLKHDQSVFTIEYSGINFTRPEKNEFAYYLEGYEETWNYVGEKRSATYTNLDAGEYTFKLKAANNDGLWNTDPLNLHITVLPPWWKTNWALVSYIALFMLGIYLLNTITQSRIREKQMIGSEREKRLRDKELDEKKFQFFTTISHEFRTPLSLIINPLRDLIEDRSLELPQRIKEKHRVIYKNTDRLYRVVNELLDFRKLELNKIGVRASEFNLAELLEEVSGHFREEAIEGNIHFSLDADKEDPMIWTDEGMLEKIVFNILSNAFKITPDGGAITIELRSEDGMYHLPLVDPIKPTKGVEILITDTGPGLEKDQLERIFDRFYQVEGKDKSYYGGTGIGLEVVQNFMNLLKGKIEVSSEVGRGTSFKLILPKGKAHFKEEELFSPLREPDKLQNGSTTMPAVPRAVNLPEREEPSCTHTLLIVEDNAELRNYLRNELRNQYRILLAADGKEGLEIAKTVLPDIILTDVIMPTMDGFEFCKKIKGDLRTSHIPLLMLTAKARIDDRLEGIGTGADAYMVKPFDMRLLRLRLSQLIHSRQIIFNKYFSLLSDLPTNGNTTALDKEFLEKVMNHIHENIDDPELSVEALASQLNLSRSQFYRKIKALSGQTANEFLRNIRLLRAKQLLELGNSSISEVCFSVGFSSPSYFTKCFKAQFGILPTEIQIQES